MKVGFTTTIPVEFVLAGGHTPVDLNNIFVCHKDPASLIEEAHADGMPRNLCTWIKGLYSVAMKESGADSIVSVANGDCSNTHALTELYSASGISVHNFAYPYGEADKYNYLKKQMELLGDFLGATLKKASDFCSVTGPIRRKLKKLDELTSAGKVSGFDNHLWLVSSTDFNGDLEKFSKDLDEAIYKAEHMEAKEKAVRIGVAGVPTINPGMYGFIESKDCKVVFNEVQRQFSIPSENPDYVNRYIEYTYPYGIMDRIADMKEQIALRRIDGMIHYVQSFCYRHIQDVLLRKYLGVPILTIEGDTPGDIDGRTKIRIDSFVEMLENRKKR